MHSTRCEQGRRLRGCLIKLAIGLVLMTIVAQFVDLGVAARALVNLDPAWLAIAFATYTATRFVMGLKWWVILGGRRSAIGYLVVQRTVCLSDFYGLLFPNSLAVDALRAGLLRHHPRGLAFVTGAILADRVTTAAVTALASLAGLALLALTWPAMPMAAPVLLVATLVPIIVIAAAIVILSPLPDWLARCIIAPSLDLEPGHPTKAARASRLLRPAARLAAIARKVHEAMADAIREPARVTAVTALAALVVLLRIIIVFALFVAIKAAVPFSLVLALEPILSTTSMLPISFMGLGVQDGMFAFLFGGAGVATTLAVAVSLAIYGLVITNSLILGLLATALGPPLPTAAGADGTIAEAAAIDPCALPRKTDANKRMTDRPEGIREPGSAHPSADAREPQAARNGARDAASALRPARPDLSGARDKTERV